MVATQGPDAEFFGEGVVVAPCVAQKLPKVPQAGAGKLEILPGRVWGSEAS